MNREEFITTLRSRLSGLPQSEIEERISFYNEMIADRIEDGLTEEEAVAGIGSIDSVVEQIMSEIPLSTIVSNRVKTKKSPNVLVIILLVLGFPVWFPLLISAAAIVLSLYITVWALVISLYAIVASLGVTALACLPIIAMQLMSGSPGSAIFFTGMCIASAGLTILCALLSVAVTKGLLKLTKNILIGIKTSLIGKGDN